MHSFEILAARLYVQDGMSTSEIGERHGMRMADRVGSAQAMRDSGREAGCDFYLTST
jgi:hypothetical protein